MSPDCELLIKALLAEPANAEVYWRKWRAETDLDSMSEDCVRLLPVLVARSSPWLANDPSRNMILGLAKRAWARNQLRVRAFIDLIASLERSGVVLPAVAGPAAWALLHQRETSFRPVSFLELLTSREDAAPLAGALMALGWTLAPGQRLPPSREFDYVEGIWFRDTAGEGLKLTWRLFPAPPERAVEWESSVPLEIIEFQGARLSVPSRDAMLACALAADREGDPFDWRCDAGLLLRSGSIDWVRLKKWIQFSPAARARLIQLAGESGAAIPSSLRRRPASVWFQWELVCDDYRRRSSVRGESRSFRGFFRYLCERWQTPAWRAPFLGLFYLARYTFSRLPRA